MNAVDVNVLNDVTDRDLADYSQRLGRDLEMGLGVEVQSRAQRAGSDVQYPLIFRHDSEWSAAMMKT